MDFQTKFNDVVKKLKLIQGVSDVGDKLNISTYEVQKAGIWSSICRTYAGESRQDTIKFITDTINSAFEIIKKDIPLYKKKLLEDGESEEFAGKVCELYTADLINNITKAKKGMKNLYNRTYYNDIYVSCELKTLLHSTKLRLTLSS